MRLRYRYEAERLLQFTTVELIIEQARGRRPREWLVRHWSASVWVRTRWRNDRSNKTEVSGSPARVWELPYSRAKALGLEDRIEKRRISNSRHLKDVYCWTLVGV